MLSKLCNRTKKHLCCNLTAPNTWLGKDVCVCFEGVLDGIMAYGELFSCFVYCLLTNKLETNLSLIITDFKKFDLWLLKAFFFPIINHQLNLNVKIYFLVEKKPNKIRYCIHMILLPKKNLKVSSVRN